MRSLALFLAIGGTLSICGGSFFAIVAPVDGQTGMLAFPAWFFGGMAGIGALILIVASREAREAWPSVTFLGLVALISIAWSFYASATYVSATDHPAQTEGSKSRETQDSESPATRT